MVILILDIMTTKFDVITYLRQREEGKHFLEFAHQSFPQTQCVTQHMLAKPATHKYWHHWLIVTENFSNII